MTYKLNPELRKIRSPVTLIFPDGMEKNFESGREIANAVFDKHYLIDEIKADGNVIKLKLMEQARAAVVNWNGEEAVSFF